MTLLVREACHGQHVHDLWLPKIALADTPRRPSVSAHAQPSE
jgi:hypothetical protein